MAYTFPQTPISNAGLYYVNGLQLSNDVTNPTTTIDIAVGQCRDSTNTNDIFVNAVYNVTTVPPTLVTNYVTASTTFVGAGGLDTGVVAINTMYAVYAIGSSANQPFLVNYAPINVTPPTELPFSAVPGAAILSLSFVQPVLPQGYDMYRRIGAVVTDGAGHIEEFRQTGNASQRTMRYGVGVGVVAAGHAVGYTAVSLNVNAPAVPPIATDVLLLVQITPTVAGNEVAFQPTGAGAGSIYAYLSGSVAGIDQQATLTCPCNAASSISYKVTEAGDAVTYAVSGYVDLL